MAKKIQDGNQIVTNVDSNDNLTFSIKSSFIDSTPTANSTNLVTSGGVKSALDINTTDIGTLSNLTTTSKTNLVSAINELETDKLETRAIVNEPSTETDEVYSSDYLNDKLVSVGSEAPTDGRRVWFKKGKNLYNNALISANLNKARTTITYENEQIVMRTTGADAYFGNIVFVGNSWSVQYGQLISVEPNTNYTLSITNNVVDKNFITYCDENKVSIKIDYNQPYQVTFTTPNNAKYVSFRFGTANSTSNGVYKFNIQLEKGSTATTYEPYVEEGIYVDEERMLFDNYSTEEIKIGTWIDGKPLYRKVITFGALANSGNKTIPYGSSNNLIKFDIYAKNPTSNYLFKVPLGGTNYINSYVEINSHQIVVQTNSDRTNVTDNYVIIEYTKTTD